MSEHTVIFNSDGNNNDPLQYQKIKEWWQNLSDNEVDWTTTDSSTGHPYTTHFAPDNYFVIQNTNLSNNVLTWSINNNNYQLEVEYFILHITTSSSSLQVCPIESRTKIHEFWLHIPSED